MERFALDSAVGGYHVYYDDWRPSAGAKLKAVSIYAMDKFAVKVIKKTVSHLPWELSCIRERSGLK